MGSPDLRRGIRFAPTPSSTFHLGNLRTAWISLKLAQVSNRPWVLRIDDLDRERCRPEYLESQLKDLRALAEATGIGAQTVSVGLSQSARSARYREVLVRGLQEGWLYRCVCSRSQMQRGLRDPLLHAPHEPAALYDGKCRLNPPEVRDRFQIRMKAPDLSGRADLLVGRAFRSPSADPDREWTFQAGYPLASVVDDGDLEVGLIVRAVDLRDVLPSQKQLWSWIFTSPPERAALFPAVFHTRMVTQRDRRRLEKRTGGVTLKDWLARGESVESLIRYFEQTAHGLPQESDQTHWAADQLYQEDSVDEKVMLPYSNSTTEDR